MNLSHSPHDGGYKSVLVIETLNGSLPPSPLPLAAALYSDGASPPTPFQPDANLVRHQGVIAGQTPRRWLIGRASHRRRRARGTVAGPPPRRWLVGRASH
jgi:hypothetical protein